MLKKTHSLLALAASATIGAGILMAADPPTNVDSSNSPNGAVTQERGAHTAIMDQLREISKDPNSAGDKLFLLNTDIDNTAEIRLNEKVAAQDSDPMIKKLADHMIQDHQALVPKLEQQAQDVGIQLPHEVPGVQSEEGKIITSMSSKQMERAYLAHMSVAHQKLIACFESQIAMSANPKIRQFATDTLPTLQDHLAMVQRTADAEGIILTPNEPTPAAARIRNGTERPGAGANAPIIKQ